jgi:electron-transferring-flavoprotein dehydrogenase
MTRQKMDFDLIIVGAGPAGLSAAIRYAQLARQQDATANICVLDKGAAVGAHILSGAVLEPRALDELIPDWQQKNAPLNTAVTKDKFIFLTQKLSLRLPTPSQMNNQGNYIISLGAFCQWLAAEAESLGVNIFPGFAVTDVIYENDKVVGVITGDKGVDTHGEHTSRYQAGIELYAPQTFFAEGCRGSLTKKIIAKYQLQAGKDPQTYGLGIKELWEIPESLHQKGLVTHTIGWPLDSHTYGGSFLYHFDKNLLAVGLVVGLDYKNPYLNPYEEFQRLKTHSSIAPLLRDSKRIGYGARTLNEGGYQSIPKLTFPGGLLIGCAAGFLNVAKIKGIHNAMKSGMLAAECAYAAASLKVAECVSYPVSLKNSWVEKDLYQVRNIHPAMQWGLYAGLAYSALDTYIFRGNAPWTLHHRQPDNEALRTAENYEPLVYPKHDNRITFDVSTSLFLSSIDYVENQPYHLKLASQKVAIDINFKLYASPETRYCPAGVYEITYDNNKAPHLFIHGGNCLQCKACDIKDPAENITWTPSEGGSGPSYQLM